MLSRERTRPSVAPKAMRESAEGRQTMKHLFAVRRSWLMAAAAASFALAGGCGGDAEDGSAAAQELTTVVPGQAGRSDGDGNGYADVGVVVNGHYRALYAYDASGAWYWDLGDGRVEGTVPAVGALDQATLTRCEYVVSYRGAFDNDPFLDSGWISNHIRCHGFTSNTVHNSLFVHRTDPRYQGDPARAIWGDWEIHVDTRSHFGNWARPHRHH
jgi:hypothetical protein